MSMGQKVNRRALAHHVLEPASVRLGRPVHPILYSAAELSFRRAKRNAFVTRVLGQPKMWVIGGDDDLAAP